MAIFRNRPFASAICCFLLVSLIGIRLSASIKLVLLLLSFFIALWFTIRSIRRHECGPKSFYLILCALGVCIACLQSLLFFDVSVGKFSEKAGEEIVIEGYVCEVGSVSHMNSTFGLRLEEANGERTFLKIRLECEYASSLRLGDRVRLRGTVRLPENTDLYHEESAIYSDGYVGIVTCHDYQNCTVLDGSKITLRHRILNIQRNLSFRMRQALVGEGGALASALFLGDKSHLSDDTVLAFRRGGVSHLLALSGLHISIIIALLDWVMKNILWIKKRYRPILVLIGVVIYLLITGCAPSTLRAVIMLGFLYVSLYIGEDYDGFTTLCMAMLLIFTVAPYSVLDLSLWLSFVATAGIVIFVPAVGEWFRSISEDSTLPKPLLRVARILLNTLAVGFFANVAILPLSTYLFGSTSVLSIVLTMVLSPLITLALLFSALTLLFPFFTPITFVTSALMKLILAAIEWVGDFSNVVVLLNGSVTVLLVIFLSVLLILFAVIELKKRRWLLLPLALSLVILAVGYADVLPKDQGIVATYLSTGKDEALVLAEGKTAVAVDFSSGSATISRQICNTVTNLKCTELQELILTHYHPEATFQIASICAQIKLRNIRMPVPENDDDRAIASRLEEEAALHDVDVCYGTENMPLRDTQIQYYRALRRNDRAESSVLFLLDVCGQRVVYASGSVWEGEIAHLSRDAALSADVFIFGAHGTYTISPSTFFEDLRDTERVIFGSKEVFDIFPRHALPQEYWVQPTTKQFSFQRTAHR